MALTELCGDEGNGIRFIMTAVCALSAALPAKLSGGTAHIFLLSAPMPGEGHLECAWMDADAGDATESGGVHAQDHEQAVVELVMITGLVDHLARFLIHEPTTELDFFIINLVDMADAHQKVIKAHADGAMQIRRPGGKSPHSATYYLIALDKAPSGGLGKIEP